MQTGQRDWYELFSRGARDWLRHNDKVRNAVRDHLPEIISSSNLMSEPGPHSVQVPLRLLEHARFRLAENNRTTGAGQGPGQPGDLLLPPDEAYGDEGGAGNAPGTVTLMMEFAIDDIVDWLWQEFQLPSLQPRGNATLEQPEFLHRGWDKHGARSRLDRRRTIKEAIKRRAVQRAPAAFTNEDLRFRQLVERPRPSSNAVVFMVLDVSSSMTQAERRLAKTFFFLALQGLRRSYHRLELRFLAHAARAWEFNERDFFEVSGMGGTMASTGFELARTLLEEHYDPASYNSYLFYASDGDNFSEDRTAAGKLLGQLAGRMNYLAYVETLPGMPRMLETEMGRLWKERERQGLPLSSVVLTQSEDIIGALKQFLTHQAAAEEAA
ncbi:DUF444 family protein [Duganella violaceipulchra]|uniref:DUF444 family protein n=1 Tax=Duganella violaceipulchra TaxID=2849652 RepID=A0AA41H7A2_9BURK|nr:DUF444 family protein [Duganella violaceicalia]MBV6321840.1 DUF444 family protein [Duganella violaceicalia]MCP2007166.1 uncharacterized sporulation protein YeaH/YhbH (DUF444 family) [Duganella violaceicalia]